LGKAEITTLEGGEVDVRGKQWGKEGEEGDGNFFSPLIHRRSNLI